MSLHYFSFNPTLYTGAACNMKKSLSVGSQLHIYIWTDLLLFALLCVCSQIAVKCMGKWHLHVDMETEPSEV